MDPFYVLDESIKRLLLERATASPERVAEINEEIADLKARMHASALFMLIGLAFMVLVACTLLFKH
jgi:hypothetical protein